MHYCSQLRNCLSISTMSVYWCHNVKYRDVCKYLFIPRKILIHSLITGDDWTSVSERVPDVMS